MLTYKPFEKMSVDEKVTQICLWAQDALAGIRDACDILADGIGADVAQLKESVQLGYQYAMLKTAMTLPRGKHTMYSGYQGRFLEYSPIETIDGALRNCYEEIGALTGDKWFKWERDREYPAKRGYPAIALAAVEKRVPPVAERLGALSQKSGASMAPVVAELNVLFARFSSVSYKFYTVSRPTGMTINMTDEQYRSSFGVPYRPVVDKCHAYFHAVFLSHWQAGGGKI